MPEIHLNLTETTVDGPRSRRWVLEAGDCRELAVHRIARLGIDEVVTPYRRVRLKPAGSFILAVLEGQGRVFLDGRWQTVRAGTVCMAPPRILNAFYPAPGQRWRFCWVRYDEPPGMRPLVTAASPVKIRCDTVALGRIVEGLRSEWEGNHSAPLIHHWLELLQGHARRLAQPWRMNDRLWKLWEDVSVDLSAAWTLELLAKRLHVSKEHLRRLCLRELGRSPMQQLTCLRMQRAQELLLDSPDKLEVIATVLGYDGGLAFSRAFKRWVGCSPSEYRGRK
ncbi:MAG TPA: AraC family transcriptional regulator [Roseimicrobium sp.]|nr:AraC family transcriptional regulator [Roseimicrobium sp.]